MKKLDSASKANAQTPDTHVSSGDVFASFAQHYIMENFKNRKAIGIPTLNITITDTCSSEGSCTDSNQVIQRTSVARR